MKPFILILSSPSGGGKTTIAKTLLSARDDLAYSVSATTRAPREGEVDGVDYHFLSDVEFKKRRDEGAFLESASYGGHLYGTLAESVDQAMDEGCHIVLDIEVSGARQIRERRNDIVSIFILPPSASDLVERLGKRNTETRGDLETRMRAAIEELKEAPQYDYVVVNEDKIQAVAEVAAIIDAEGKRTGRQEDLRDIIETLRLNLVVEVEARAGG